MINNSLPPEIQKLSIAEKIQLVEDIWDSISTSTDEIKLTNAQKLELDNRLDKFQPNSNIGSTWEEVKQRIKHGE